MNIDTGMYIHKCRLFIELMLSNQQWSGLTKSDIDRWISNFVELGESEKYYIYKLLSNIIYFSEKDVENILRDGVFNHLFGNIILNNQIVNKFQLSMRALENIVIGEIRKTCFIPLLDASAPHESGNYISRILVQKGIIYQYQSLFCSSIDNDFISRGFNRIVIVDDCVGSGDQLTEYWTEKATINIEENNKKMLLKDWSKNNGIEVHYLTLFGYENNIIQLQSSLPELKIHCVKMLGDVHRVFGDNSYVWDDNEEKECALKIINQIAYEKSIDLYGYKGLDFALVMHQTIPDWSLPLFWRETPDWKCLIRRKNSNA